MRSLDQPLPGDIVIRHLPSKGLRDGVYVLTHWPDADTHTAGPYQSYGYALRQARLLIKDASVRIWRDHAPVGHPEALEQIAEA